MSFPLAFTVGHRRYDTSRPTDELGNQVDFWFPAELKPVYGWGAPNRSAPKVIGHDRVVVEIELLVPLEFECGPHDRMVLDGDEYDVVGGVEMYDHSPFGWNPGGVVNLVRTTG